MNKENRELLKQFQCDEIRQAEESFAQTLSENNQVRLFFINENQAFTDGRNIVVDPAQDELFADQKASKEIETFLKWPTDSLNDPFNVLHLVTRAQTIHECLHLLYTDFPAEYVNNPKFKTKNEIKTIAMISNIIEDAYIEAAGCSVFDNLELFLKFMRVARLFANNLSEGTIEREFKQEFQSDSNITPLTDYLEYMATFLLYPMVQLSNPSQKIVRYVEMTKELFIKGSISPACQERYQISCQIYDLIYPLIPENEEIQSEKIELLLGEIKTHRENQTIFLERHQGRRQEVFTHLFTDLDGKMKTNENDIQQLIILIAKYQAEKEIILTKLNYTGYITSYTGRDYDCSIIHKNIQIKENHPKINLNLKKAYQNIYHHYKINIDSYNSKFIQLLKGRTTVKEENYQYGVGISSKKLADPQKRYWYRNIIGIDIPDMAILLLIDGSGSMDGARRENAMYSSIILHEVLKKQEIEHAIVEHRAVYNAPEMDVNVLVGFHAKEEEKYNLMQLDALDNSRDSLALFWAERYLNQNVNNEHKIIIVISDGEPYHAYDDYSPPVSIQDCANAVKKIMKRGTEIIAISLDDEDSFETYDSLKAIYPNLVRCNDLTRLTGQLLGIISKLL
ncbi:MAG: hypothetical protein ACI4U3_00865 [Traorella sp.]